MLWHIFRFEVLFRLRRMSTYVYFLIWFFMMFFSVSVRQFGPGSIGGKVLVNSPYILATAMSTLTIFGIVVIAAIFGTAIYRDFEQDTYQLFFTRPITKLDYLGGRFLGSFVVCALIFSGLVLGAMAGTFMPWADQARLMPIDLWAHLQPYLMFTLVATFFLGAIFFMVGAVTRSIVAVNLQGVVFFALYLIVHRAHDDASRDAELRVAGGGRSAGSDRDGQDHALLDGHRKEHADDSDGRRDALESPGVVGRWHVRAGRRIPALPVLGGGADEQARVGMATTQRHPGADRSGRCRWTAARACGARVHGGDARHAMAQPDAAPGRVHRQGGALLGHRAHRHPVRGRRRLVRRRAAARRRSSRGRI